MIRYNANREGYLLLLKRYKEIYNVDFDETKPVSEEYWAHLLDWVENTAPYLDGWAEWEAAQKGEVFDPDLGREDY